MKTGSDANVSFRDRLYTGKIVEKSAGINETSKLLLFPSDSNFLISTKIFSGKTWTRKKLQSKAPFTLFFHNYSTADILVKSSKKSTVTKESQQSLNSSHFFVITDPVREKSVELQSTEVPLGRTNASNLRYKITQLVDDEQTTFAIKSTNRSNKTSEPLWPLNCSDFLIMTKSERKDLEEVWSRPTAVLPLVQTKSSIFWKKNWKKRWSRWRKFTGFFNYTRSTIVWKSTQKIRVRDILLAIDSGKFFTLRKSSTKKYTTSQWSEVPRNQKFCQRWHFSYKMTNLWSKHTRITIAMQSFDNGMEANKLLLPPPVTYLMLVRATKMKPKGRIVTVPLVSANVSIFPGETYTGQTDILPDITEFPALITADPTITKVGAGSVIFSDEFLRAENRKDFLINNLKVTAENVTHIEKETIGQSRNPKWLSERKYRITASNFGPVLKAIERDTFPPSLFARVSGTVWNLDNVKPIVWGRENEGNAIKCFSEAMGFTIQECGLWLHESGMLGASPDGIVVGEDAIVEIKCPYSFRLLNITDVMAKMKDYILTIRNNAVYINPNHNYYAQIQGQLHITGRSVCYLVIWTTVDWLYIKISKNPKWMNNISKLRDFYMHRFVPHLVNLTSI